MAGIFFIIPKAANFFCHVFLSFLCHFYTAECLHAGDSVLPNTGMPEGRAFQCWKSVQQICFCQLFCLFVIMKRFDLESF